MLVFFIFFCLTTGVLTHRLPKSATCSSTSSSSSTHASTNTKSTELYNGPCPHIITDPVDFTKHSGEWYEVERSANSYDGSDKCHKELWGKPVNNVSELILKSVSSSSGVTLTITSDVIQKDGKYFITHHFPSLGDLTMDYYPLKFDSSKYAIIWSCEPRGNKHIEKAWVFSRKTTPPHNIGALKCKAFAKYHLHVPKMIRHNHSDCDEFFSCFEF